MGKLDREKEEIAWIKFWIGVAVASIMGLVSWLVNHYEDADNLLLMLDGAGTILLAIFIVILNQTAIKKIKNLEEIES